MQIKIPRPYHNWFVPDAVAVIGIFHDIPRHLDNFLTKFDPNRKDSIEDHIKKFLLSVKLQSIRH